MTVDYAKRTVQRQKDRHLGRPKAVETREDRLEAQLKIVVHRLAMAHHILLDGISFMQAQTVTEQMQYLEVGSTDIMRVELAPDAEGPGRRLDHYRETDLFKTILNGIRHLVREQYQEDKFSHE